jgi:hypothetical protein
MDTTTTLRDLRVQNVDLERRHRQDRALIQQSMMVVDTCIKNDYELHEDISFYKKAWCLKGTSIGFVAGVAVCIVVYFLIIH